jgi:predicted amidohydrolase YtcJ
MIRILAAQLTAAFAALAFTLIAAPAGAQTLVHNINGYTIGADGRVTRFTALEIGADGRVRQLINGPHAPPRGIRMVDGGGRTMLPGLIDAHGHVMGLGIGALQLDLSETTSLADAQARIRAYAAANPNLPWIVGRGWNQEKWGLGRFPTAADLNSAVADRPVWLGRVDGHAGWANSAAMRAAGITAATQSPNGGRIEQANGQPSGIFVDAAEELVARHIPAPPPEFRDRALAESQRLLLSTGITATADMGTSAHDWLVMRRAGDAGRLQLRIMSYASGIDAMRAVAGAGPTPWLYDGHLRMVGVKIYSDGALGSRGAWLKHDYRDAAGQRGLGFLTDEQLRAQMEAVAAANMQVAVHAIGDAANAQLLSAIEALSPRFTGDRRWRIEHAQVVDPADLPRFGRNGIIASMQPVHQTSDMHMAEARMGLPRLGGAYAWRSMIDNGARLAFGSDYPVESPNPFHGLAAGMSREDAQGRPPGGWLPAQRLTIEQAFAAFTSNAAYAGFAEDRIGRLAPGMAADFILIDRDIFTARDQQAIRGTQVLETWVGGKRVWTAQSDPTSD